MNYTLYTRNNCKACNKVLSYLNSKQLAFNIINLDKETQDSSSGIFIVPALFNSNKLLAYGQDIETYFVKHDLKG